MLKHFQLEGLPYYVTAPNKEIAAILCVRHRWGVTPENLIEIETIPQDAAHHINFYVEN